MVQPGEWSRIVCDRKEGSGAGLTQRVGAMETRGLVVAEAGDCSFDTTRALGTTNPKAEPPLLRRRESLPRWPLHPDLDSLPGPEDKTMERRWQLAAAGAGGRGRHEAVMKTPVALPLPVAMRSIAHLTLAPIPPQPRICRRAYPLGARRRNISPCCAALLISYSLLCWPSPPWLKTSLRFPCTFYSSLFSFIMQVFVLFPPPTNLQPRLQ